jgi:membrane protein DedA with SNARE-associated domain
VDAALRIIEAISGLPPAFLYVVVFLYMVGQSAGAPLSSEALLLFGGYLVSRGRLNPVILWLAAVAGSAIGGSAAWYVARRWGPAGVDHVGRYLLLSRTKLKTAHRFFERRGVAAVVLARLLPLVQSYISYPAGLADMAYRPFIAATAVGAAAWCMGLILLGIAAGPHWSEWFQLTNGPLLMLGALVILAVAGYFIAVQVQGMRRRRSVARD